MAAFTKRHYIEIARILNGVRDPRERQRLAEEFARLFREDNPSFDVERFSSAVYGEPGGRRTARENDEDEEPEEDDEEQEDEELDQSEIDDGLAIGDARRGGYSVTFSGKSLGTFDDFDKALKVGVQAMYDSNYFPNVFYVNERGNVDLLSVKDKVVKGKVIKVTYETVRSWV